MAGPKLGRQPDNKSHFCSLCNQSFDGRLALADHMKYHADAQSAEPVCPTCRFPFSDSYKLEAHMAMAHGVTQMSRQVDEGYEAPPRINEAFTQQLSAINDRPKVESLNVGKEIYCDKCGQTFASNTKYKKHITFPHGLCADHNVKRVKYKDSPATTGLPYNTLFTMNEPVAGAFDEDDVSEFSDGSARSEGKIECKKCNKVYQSQARYNNHMLGCFAAKASKSSGPTTKAATVDSASAKAMTAAEDKKTGPDRQSHHILSIPGSALPSTSASGHGNKTVGYVQLRTKPPVPLQHQDIAPNTPQQPLVEAQPDYASVKPSATTPTPEVLSLVCGIKGCGHISRSEAGLKCHQQDNHGIGGKAIDIMGNESWMMNQRTREQLRTSGMLRSSPGPSRGGRGGAPAHLVRSSPSNPRPVANAGPSRVSPMPSATMTNANTRQTVSASQYASPSDNHHRAPAVLSGPVPTSMNLGSSADIEQAKYTHGKIMRLMIQSNIFIQHDGNLNVSDINWIRIPVVRQRDAVGMFEKMCHLPESLQNEYLPHSITFKGENTATQLPVADFKQSPDRDAAKPGMDIVAVACSKVVLQDGCPDLVKIAALDLITGRILMNHLVCTDPGAQVKDWRSSQAGLLSWNDMEGARQMGYKVFKGWSAARSALWKFIDKKTIVIGHNLRADLDALRMIHGRAIDVVKVVEKAAQGPLSKKQLSIQSLLNTFTGIQLATDKNFGRDPLIDAFACRQLGLWICKNKEQFEKDAKQHSLNYQRLLPSSNPAA